MMRALALLAVAVVIVQAFGCYAPAPPRGGMDRPPFVSPPSLTNDPAAWVTP